MTDLLADVSRETIARLERYRALLIDENGHQNLVAAASVANLWDRHILDSAQLARLALPSKSWCDVGSGAGLPGIVIACLVDGPVRLIEPRRLRADFLYRAADELGLKNVTIDCAKAERVAGASDVITARAVAPLDRFLSLAVHLSHNDTIWVLPKGRGAKSELAAARLSWQCEAREVPSQTDAQATILVLTQVEARRRR